MKRATKKTKTTKKRVGAGVSARPPKKGEQKGTGYFLSTKTKSSLSPFDDTDEVIVGLDVGTTKVCALMGVPIRDRRLVSILGVGVSPSHGLRKGVVVDISKTVSSIRKAVREAEEDAGRSIDSVFVGIAGEHISSTNTRGKIAVRSPSREITESHKQRVIDSSLRFKMPQGTKVIHVIPREFILDGVDGVLEPVGMSARHLEVRAHVVMGAIASIQNLIRCVHLAGCRVEDLILEPLASSEAVLTLDEKELGTALIDIGGGTTDLAIFMEKGICYSHVFPFGGNHVTRDIAVGLRISLKEAEDIKIRHGIATMKIADPTAVFRVQDLHSRKKRNILKVNLAGIIEPRLEEIFRMVKREIDKSGMAKLLAGGVVLTGGSSQLEGMAVLASDILELPCRVGTPSHVKGPTRIVRNSVYATGVGLLLYAKEYHEVIKTSPSNRTPKLTDLVNRVRKWFAETVTDRVSDKLKSKG
ncbi:MAG: cell division protein FtsA [Actinomycetota bacterium]